MYSGLVEQEYMTPDFNPLGGALVEVNGENKVFVIENGWTDGLTDGRNNTSIFNEAINR